MRIRYTPIKKCKIEKKNITKILTDIQLAKVPNEKENLPKTNERIL